jgi:maleylacetoacetate isomerase
MPNHLVRDGGEQKKPSYRAVNPLGRVPALAVGGPGAETVLTQSLAIIDYLDETVPEPPLLPADPLERAQVRALAQTIACDIHPLNNTLTLGYLKSTIGASQEAADRWYAFFIREGFAALERMVRPGPYCWGDRVTVADVCLAPQMFNARRFKVPVDDFPRLVAITDACMALKPFADAQPSAQPDAE